MLSNTEKYREYREESVLIGLDVVKIVNEPLQKTPVFLHQVTNSVEGGHVAELKEVLHTPVPHQSYSALWMRSHLE